MYIPAMHCIYTFIDFQPPVVSSQPVRLGPGDQGKLDDVLSHFSSICLSAVLESPDIHVSVSYILACSQCMYIHLPARVSSIRVLWK